MAAPTISGAPTGRLAQRASAKHERVEILRLHAQRAGAALVEDAVSAISSSQPR